MPGWRNSKTLDAGRWMMSCARDIAIDAAAHLAGHSTGIRSLAAAVVPL